LEDELAATVQPHRFADHLLGLPGETVQFDSATTPMPSATDQIFLTPRDDGQGALGSAPPAVDPQLTVAYGPWRPNAPELAGHRR
jgi:hypothetical protein